MSKKLDFIHKLQQEAKSQSKLHTTRFFPQQLDRVTSFIGRHPWQVLLVSSGLTSLFIEFGKWGAR